MDALKTISTWVAATIIAIIIMLVGQKCSAQTKAQYDTIYCNVECIKKFSFEQKDCSKKRKIYAVYVDEKNNILDLIPVSESVYSYVALCKSNGIRPSLGIKLRNGEIYSLIKVKPKYIKKK